LNELREQPQNTVDYSEIQQKSDLVPRWFASDGDLRASAARNHGNVRSTPNRQREMETCDLCEWLGRAYPLLLRLKDFRRIATLVTPNSPELFSSAYLVAAVAY
jgi:hypothetical protein